MVRRFTFTVLFCLFLVPAIDAQAPAWNRTDVLGDALPKGAIARLGTLRFKHEPARGAVINAAMFSPDGNKIVSLEGGGSGTIRLWDARTGQSLPGPWDSGSWRCTAIAFSADSAILAAAVQRQGKNEPTGAGIMLWDIAAAKSLGLLPEQKKVRALVFADGGKTVIAAGDDSVRWWDIAAAKEQRTWRAFADDKKPAKAGATKGKTFFNCSLSPDAKFLVVEPGVPNLQMIFDQLEGAEQFVGGNRDTETIAYDLTSGKVAWRSQSTLPVSSNTGIRFAFSADGKRVAFADPSDQVTFRDTVSGKVVASAAAPTKKAAPRDDLDARETLVRAQLLLQRGIGSRPPPSASLALSPNGTTMALCVSDGNVALWDQENPKAMRRFPVRTSPNSGPAASAVTFSPDGKHILVGVGATMKLYDVATLKEVAPLDGHERPVEFITFSPDGKRVLTGTSQVFLDSGSALAWESSTWKRISGTADRPAGLPDVGMFSPDHTHYVGIGAENQYGLYDLAAGKLVAALTVPKNQARTRGLFSPDSKYFVLPGTDSKGKLLQRLYGTSSGKLLCLLPPQGQPVDLLRPMDFSTDGRLVALFSRDDGLLHIYEIATGKLQCRLGKVPEGRGRIFASNLAFSPDGRQLVSWNAGDNVFRVWDVTAGTLQRILPPDGEVHARPRLAWSPDGRSLAIGERTIHMWELSALKVRHEFTGHQGDIRALAFSPNGRLLASGSSDTTALIWDVWAGSGKMQQRSMP